MKLLEFPILLKFTLLGSVFIAGAMACSGTETLTDDREDSEELSDLESLYWTRIDSSRMSFTQADVDFMTDMIAHHAQALVISRLAPQNEASRSIQTLAARIINAQKDEIVTMQKWLRDRNQPVPEVQIDGLNLTIAGLGHHHGSHQHDMPGMLSQAQIEELAGLKGEAFDQTFLKYMIQHHEGAVVMVRELFGTDGAAQDEEAFRLASDIQVDQITEIERMNLMLENMTNS